MSRSTVERTWTHAGLDCAVLAIDMGHRCGYVRVPNDHPWHGLHYSDRVPPETAKALPEDATVDDYGMAGMIAALSGTVADRVDRVELQVRVHGGITYSGAMPHGLAGWWFGFDTAHLDDTPERWTVDAVAAETERMAEQIAAVGVAA